MYAIADTHALVWYLLNDPRLSPAAKAAFTMAAAIESRSQDPGDRVTGDLVDLDEGV